MNQKNKQKPRGHENELIVALASVKLTILLLTVLVILSAAATLLPHINIYHSPLYVTILVMIGLNLLTCSIRRLNRLKWKRKQRNYGYFFTHLGLLIILIGATITLLFGVRFNIWISKGETISDIQMATESQDGSGIKTLPLGFALTLDEFELKLHSSGMPDEFLSHVTIQEPGKPARKVDIAVNSPLRLNGYSLYQSNYRVDPEIFVTLGIKTAPDAELKQTRIQVGSEPRRFTFNHEKGFDLAVLRYEPDFVMGGPDRFGSRSALPNNPAIMIGTLVIGRSPETKWLFLRHKNVHTGESDEGITVTFDAVDHAFDTGLEIVKDPGTPWVAIGALLLVFGLLLYLIPLKSTGSEII